jgi:hypothetical protein
LAFADLKRFADGTDPRYAPWQFELDVAKDVGEVSIIAPGHGIFATSSTTRWCSLRPSRWFDSRFAKSASTSRPTSSLLHRRGLSIAEAVAAAHRGTVMLLPSAPERGATFRATSSVVITNT